MVEYSGYYDYKLIDYIITPLASLVTGIILFFAMILPLFDAVRKTNIVKRILLLSILGVLYSLVFILILHLFPIVFYPNPSNYMKSVFGFIAADFHNVLKNYIFQIAILYVYEYISNETRLIRQQKNLEIELNKTRLQILKSQLQPHFLFNALNSIVAEIDHSKEKAQEMLVNLSDILRATLNADFERPVTLEEEIITIRKFLAIEKVRYEEQLDYEINISAEAAKMKLPGLILQPLIENAIKHGFKGMQQSLKIIIEADANREFISVKNNGAALNELTPQIGLSNVSERMKIMTGSENSFEIYQDGVWVINKIRLK